MSLVLDNNRIIAKSKIEENNYQTEIFKKELKDKSLIEFRYIKPEQFLKIDERKIVLGYVNIDNISNTKSKNVLEIDTEEETFNFVIVKTEKENVSKIKELLKEDRNIEEIFLDNEDYNYEIKETKINNIKKLTTIGFVEVEKNIFIEIKKETIEIVKIAIGTGIFIALICSLFILNKKDPQIQKINNQEVDIEIAEATDWDGKMPQNGENSQTEVGSIEIPGYANLFITTQKPEVQLINPSVNDVYFVYKIYENEELIQETKAIEPGKVLNVDLGTELGVGEHKVTFDISCVDIKTKTPCNGAVQTVKITVK